MAFIKTHYLISLLILVLPNLISTEPLTLTDKTWKDMLCGQWMVKFHAPWCPSCQHFEPIWSDFAKAMIAKEIKVAAIDINEYPSLSGRFRISVLPTIYYVRDGVFRQYHGARTLDGLKNYIEFQDWKRTEPVSAYGAPDSFPMTMVSSLFDVSVLVKDAYTILQDQYGWSAWLIYIVFTLVIIIVGLILGFGVLMIIDFCISGTPKDDITHIPNDSRDAEESEESDTPKPWQPKKSSIPVPIILASSTPQRKTTTATTTKVTKPVSSPVVEIQDDEALLDEVLAADQDDDDDSEELNNSDAAQATDEEEQTKNAAIRHRRANQ